VHRERRDYAEVQELLVCRSSFRCWLLSDAV